MQTLASIAYWYCPAGQRLHVGGCPVQYDPAGHVSGPEDTPEPDTSPDDVSSRMPLATLEPLVPMVNPRIVTINAAASTVAPDVVITTDVELVMPHVAVSPATLLAPSDTLGVIDEAKKPEG